MHVLAQLFQAFLMLHAEMLFLVDDEKAEIGEIDRLSEQRMGPDHDIDVALLEAFLGRVELLAGDKARGLRDADGKAAEPLGERIVVLARQKRGRHDDSHLLAREHGHQARAERHLGLAEADIAADQTVHGTSAGQIVQHRVDAGHLVFRLLVREARGELFIGPVGRRERRCGPQFPHGRDFNEFLGHVANALLQLGLA